MVPPPSACMTGGILMQNEIHLVMQNFFFFLLITKIDMKNVSNLYRVSIILICTMCDQKLNF